ncbi:MAG: DUF3078 domain-containing protein [Bacteroidetes bacterium]|nr:DUF3078 domain-containing protein [Bacteroidota bacterium]
MKGFACVLVAMTCLAGGVSVAQEGEGTPVPKNWATTASLGLNVTNVGLQNWAGGGENSFSIAGLLKGEATYTKNRVQWLNTLEAGYGLVRQGSISEFRKSDDRLILVSKWSRDFGTKHLAYTALLDFRTQMTNGYNYFQDEDGAWQREVISRLMAPGYLALSLGASYKPSDEFYAMVSPLSGKLTFVMDNALSAVGAFGVDSGKTLRKELGAVINMRYARELAKNVKFETKANFFQAYRQGAMVDVMWDNLLELKVNDFISSTISTQMIYDEDVLFPNDDGSSSPRVQWKYVFNVGFLFRI